MPTVRHYIALGSVIFIAVVVVNLPAKVLFDAVNPQLPVHSTLKVNEIEGSIWKGRLGFAYAGIAFSADWDILLMQILRGRLAADVVVFDISLNGPRSSTSKVGGQVFASVLKGAGFEGVDGRLTALLVNHLTANQFVNEQDITLKALSVAYRKQRFFGVKGELIWAGGRVGYQDPGRGQQQVVMPALQAVLKEQGGELLIHLVLQGTEDVLVDAKVNGEGMATLTVHKRLLDLMGQRWGKAVDPDEVVLEIQQAVF